LTDAPPGINRFSRRAGLSPVALAVPIRLAAACLALCLIVACRVLFVTRLGRVCPEMPCGAVFTEAEWRAVYQIVKRQPAAAMPGLGELLVMIAELGGYLNRKHAGPPGPQTIWIGLQRGRDFALTWSVFTAPSDLPSCVER
jgi:hypothetical protein